MSAKASKEITPEEHAIIELAWCDKTSFDEIEQRYDVPEGDVIKLMRRHLKRSSFKIWRERVSGRRLKHRAKRKSAETRL